MWQDDWKGSSNRINVFTSTVEAREEDQVDNRNEHNFMKKKEKGKLENIRNSRMFEPLDRETRHRKVSVK